jgi:hypothetical protein
VDLHQGWIYYPLLSFPNDTISYDISFNIAYNPMYRQTTVNTNWIHFGISTSGTLTTMDGCKSSYIIPQYIIGFN